MLRLKKKAGITIFLTTHYMDEAEICDRIAVMDHGELIALDAPDQLKREVGGDIVEIETEDNKKAKTLIEEKYQADVTEIENRLTFQVDKGDEFLVNFVKEFDIPIKTVNLRRPTLNDVFLHLTGREIREETVSEKDKMRKQMRRGPR